MNKKARILRKENNELDKQINDENNQVLTDMICYIRGADISEYDQEKVRNDLNEMVLSAQMRGESIDHVIGEDYKEFCDEVISTISKISIREKFIKGIDLILLVGAILGAINLILSLETFQMILHAVQGKKVNYNVSLTMGHMLEFLWIFVASYGIVEVICRQALNGSLKTKDIKSNKKKVKDFMVRWIVCMVIMGIAILCMEFGTPVIVQVNIFVGLAVVAGLFGLERIMNELY